MRGMSPRDLLRPFLPFLWTFVPMYGTERLADYYFLTHNQSFYLISGWRLEVFILSCLLGSLAAGSFLKSFKLAVITQIAALASVFFLLYLVCDPRVCYSSSPDGLEPFRLGFFLGSVIVSGVSLGLSTRGNASLRRWESTIVAAAAFAAVSWYPIIFTFAGTGLLGPISPWGTMAVIFFVSLSTSSGASKYLPGFVSSFLPIATILLVFAISAGIASQYSGSLGPLVLLTAATAVVGSTLGAVLAKSRRTSRVRSSLATSGFAVAIILVLIMTLVIVPDAVAGVVPSGSSQRYSIGTPVYAGAYMYAPQGHTLGAGINVTFDLGDPGIIPVGNFLSGGIGIHGAGCCVDGIDYAYRYDAYLFHNGSTSLLASAWEACDDNLACGGHSWKALIFSKALQLDGIGTGGTLALRMQWVGEGVVWSYGIGESKFVNMTLFETPPEENKNFNTGISGGVSLSSQKEAFFYQFGVMSAKPFEAGWNIHFECPSLFDGVKWSCIDHARALTGSNSYWKVIWRWGEDYPGINIVPYGQNSALFGYSPTNATSDQTVLW